MILPIRFHRIATDSSKNEQKKVSMIEVSFQNHCKVFQYIRKIRKIRLNEKTCDALTQMSNKMSAIEKKIETATTKNMNEINFFNEVESKSTFENYWQKLKIW